MGTGQLDAIYGVLYRRKAMDLGEGDCLSGLEPHVDVESLIELFVRAKLSISKLPCFVWLG